MAQRTCNSGFLGCLCWVEKLLGFGRRNGTFFLGSGILEGSCLPFAPVENVCGASLKTHWTTEGERFICERVAISSWGLLLPLLPWGVMQIEVAARFETYCSLFWVVLLQALLPEMCELQGDVYLYAAGQF